MLVERLADSGRVVHRANAAVRGVAVVRLIAATVAVAVVVAGIPAAVVAAPAAALVAAATETGLNGVCLFRLASICGQLIHINIQSCFNNLNAGIRD